MRTSVLRRAFLMVLVLGLLMHPLRPSSLSAAQSSSTIKVLENETGYTLSAESLGNFYDTINKIQNARLIELPPSPIKLVLWEETEKGGAVTPFYAISLDGQKVARLQQTSYDLLLRYGQFDPIRRELVIPEMLKAKSMDQEADYIVQFVTQPLEEFRKQIRALGGTIYKFIANHGYLVTMSPSVRDQVAALPYVRWVGPYHPAYRLEECLLGGDNSPAMRYNIQVFKRGLAQQERVAAQIRELGGTVHLITPAGFRLEATLSADALLKVAQMNEVQFIDRWGPPEADVTTAREIGGANFLEKVAGFTGDGVRGEVMDVGVRLTHQDFQSRPLIVHGATPPIQSHGTSTTGIIFGDGTGDIRGLGFLPTGQGIVAGASEAQRRYEHTAELLADPYFAVFQSNSWGGNLTTQYTTVTAEMDDIIFINDIVITQSQSNTGNQSSRPEAWAKNIVSVGGIRHYEMLTMEDHCWCRSGSIGPAADGRIKPDLAHFYDRNYTPSGTSDTSYTEFGGTSAATPIVAGHFGLFFEMWHRGLFGNPTRQTVFDSRPHMATSKAILINTAKQWNFSGPTDDLTRTHQGWGLPDLENLYNLRDKIFIVDQTDVLQNLETKTYQLTVPPAGLPLRATLVYKDPSGTTSSSQHRINKLTLKAISPSEVIYWGNNGLMTGLWSLPGGKPDSVNTVENIFVQLPEPGTWTIEVIATEINEDEHLETPEIDSDYGLIVSGVVRDAGL